MKVKEDPRKNWTPEQWLDAHIRDMRDEIARKTFEFELVLKSREKHPDLRTYKNRWERRFYKAPSAIPLCTDVEIKRSCGCCSDPAILASIYYNPFDVGSPWQVFGEVELHVGDEDYNGKVTPAKGLYENLAKNGWPEVVTNKIRIWFENEHDEWIKRRREEEEDE
jgi:hypothetical protein